MAARVAAGTTGDDGVARLQVPAGIEGALVVSAPDARRGELADEAIPYAPSDRRIVLPPATDLRGQVTDRSGAAVPYATVRARTPGGLVARVTLSGRDGSFTLSRVAARAVALEADVEDVGGARVGPATVRVDAAQGPATIVLPSVLKNPNRPARVVRVVGPSGEPVPFANVGKTVRTTQTFGGSTSTTTRITTERLDGAMVDYDVDAPAALEVFRAATELGEPLPFGPTRAGPFGAGEFEVRLGPETTIVGRVVDGSGAPVAAVRVTATSTASVDDDVPIARIASRNLHATTVSGSDGAFHLRGLGRQRYRLEAATLPGYAGCRAVDAAGGATDARLVLRAPVRPTITVRDGDGNPVAKASVIVRAKKGDGDGDPVQGATGDDGVVRLGELDPEAAYRLTVTPPLAREDLLPVDRAGWKPTDLDVRLDLGLAVRGVVKDLAGKPVPGAVVSWTRAGGGGAHTTTAAADGTFSTPRVAPGPLTMTAASPRSSKPGSAAAATASKPVATEAGASDVALTLPMSAKVEVQVPYWGKSYSASLLVLAEEGPATPAVKKPLDKLGKASVDRLRWEVPYTLWIGPVGDGLVGLRRGVRTWDGPLEIELEKGQPVRGRVVAPTGTTGVKVWAVLPNHPIEGTLKSDRSFEIKLLPAGEWTVRASGKGADKAPLAAEGKVAAGGTLDLELRAP